jgi:hypothetical protein
MTEHEVTQLAAELATAVPTMSESKLDEEILTPFGNGSDHLLAEMQLLLQVCPC